MNTTPPFDLGGREAVIVRCQGGHEHILISGETYGVKVGGLPYYLKLSGFSGSAPVFLTDNLIAPGSYEIEIQWQDVLENQGR